VAVALLSGCKPGMHWRLGQFADAHEEAREAHKLTFVYFRNWYSPECGTFENDVLSDPAVRSATADLVNVPLEFDVAADQRLARRCGVNNVPAIVLLDPAGNVVERLIGSSSIADVVAAIERAKAANQPDPESKSP